MSCILRYSGIHLDVKSLVNAVSMKPDRLWIAGEPDWLDSMHKDSGVTFLASGADFDEFDLQVVDATSFLQRHREDLLTISRNAKIDYGTLDFGVWLRDTPVHSDTLTPSFLEAVAGLNIEVEISHYPCEDKN